MSALNRQVGEDKYASPYRSFVIQPAEFCERNKLSWCQANIVKYVCRFRLKNGLEDLAKARHYLDMLEEMEYGAKRQENSQTKPVSGYAPGSIIPTTFNQKEAYDSSAAR